MLATRGIESARRRSTEQNANVRAITLAARAHDILDVRYLISVQCCDIVTGSTTLLSRFFRGVFGIRFAALRYVRSLRAVAQLGLSILQQRYGRKGGRAGPTASDLPLSSRMMLKVRWASPNATS